MGCGTQRVRGVGIRKEAGAELGFEHRGPPFKLTTIIHDEMYVRQ